MNEKKTDAKKHGTVKTPRKTVPNLDFDFIERIVRLVENAEIGELEIESPEGLRLAVKKAPSGIFSSPPAMYPPMYASVPAAHHSTPITEAPAPVKAETDESIEIIKAPMVGTFYRAPAPDAPPFVEMGGAVQNSTVVCILEAMKVMNEIKAGVSGTVAEIMVENGQPVEFGQPLFKIRK
ncbi:MAG: acetyl-CoA carboxylase biotin carboxyl carrier protein [Candidatus Omnitrophota bacterium]